MVKPSVSGIFRFVFFLRGGREVVDTNTLLSDVVPQLWSTGWRARQEEDQEKGCVGRERAWNTGMRNSARVELLTSSLSRANNVKVNQSWDRRHPARGRPVRDTANGQNQRWSVLGIGGKARRRGYENVKGWRFQGEECDNDIVAEGMRGE